MGSGREEAAPSFSVWRQRLEEATERDLPPETDRFLEMLRAVGTPLIDEPSVHFIYHDPQARRVALAGEFNQWGPAGIAMCRIPRTAIFHYAMEFREPTRVEYKFIVDGRWTVDPLCPNQVDNGLGEQNSYFVVGDFREPSELAWAPNIPHGRVEEFRFESELLRNDRKVHVYLPSEYEHDSTKRFPTLYVHDGGEYLERARLAVVLDNLIDAGKIPPLIAVMVDPVNRLVEYMTNEGYAGFTETELLPYVDGRYRTRLAREARGLMGASLGGLISTYLALSRPHLFSKVGGQSSALFLQEDKITSLVRQLDTSLALYFDVGKYEPRFVPAHRRLVQRMEARGCRCLFQEVAGGHNWTSWRAHLKDLLTFLWKE